MEPFSQFNPEDTEGKFKDQTFRADNKDLLELFPKLRFNGTG